MNRRPQGKRPQITATVEGGVRPSTVVVIGALLAVVAMIALGLRGVLSDSAASAEASHVEPATSAEPVSTYVPDPPVHLSYLDIRTGETQRLPSSLRMMPQARMFLVSPDGHSFAFEALAGSRMQIFVSDVDGDDIHQLTDTPDGARLGDWAPDGRSIVFRTEDARPPTTLARIAIVDVPSGAIRTLTTSSYVFAPDFSPDGAWVLYTLAQDGVRDGWRTDLWRVPSEGGRSERLIEFGTLGAYSPDGSTIAYTRTAVIPHPFCGDCWWHELHLTRVPSDGTEQPGPARGGEITSPAVFEDLFPRWSSDGRRILIGTPNTDWRHEIYLRPARGGKGRLLAMAVEATWFDDHTLIVTDARRFDR